MPWRLRSDAPVFLVPAAWGVVTVVHLDIAPERTLLVAQVVMNVLLAAFAAASWREMESGLLRAWRTIIVVGIGFTTAGVAGLSIGAIGSRPLLAAALYGWMLAPAAGLVYTARVVDRAPRVYLAGAGLCLLGAVVYASAPVLPDALAPAVLGLTFVNLGQTVGIVNAVLQY